MATSLAVPVAYITVLVTALAIFSRIYRRRKLAEKISFEPWFPNHPSRDLYITLLSSQSETSNTNSTSEQKVTDNLLKSALLLRATEDVKRIWRIRDDKMALTNLHQRGLIGDDTMSRFANAEKELEAEIVDVVQEANSFKMGWGSMIFATATEMAHAEKTRETVINAQKIRAREEKRMALRLKYRPELKRSSISTTSADQTTTSTTTSINPPPQSTPSKSDQSQITPPSDSEPTMSSPQKVPVGSGSGGSSGTSSPAQTGASGSSSTPKTPGSSKKKKNKK